MKAGKYMYDIFQNRNIKHILSMKIVVDYEEVLEDVSKLLAIMPNGEPFNAKIKCLHLKIRAFKEASPDQFYAKLVKPVSEILSKDPDSWLVITEYADFMCKSKIDSSGNNFTL